MTEKNNREKVKALKEAWKDNPAEAGGRAIEFGIFNVDELAKRMADEESQVGKRRTGRNITHRAVEEKLNNPD